MRLDRTAREILYRELQSQREWLEDDGEELSKLRSRAEEFARRAATRFERILSIERTLGIEDAECAFAGCGLPYRLHGGRGRATGSDHRFEEPEWSRFTPEEMGEPT